MSGHAEGAEATARALDALIADEVGPRAAAVDRDARFPAAALRRAGEAGVFALAADGAAPAIDALARLSAACLTTAFCAWCQAAALACVRRGERAEPGLADDLARARRFAGIAYSNPMKAMAGIEPMKLRGERADGGYRVGGLLPFVSNAGDDGPIVALFEVDGESRWVAAVVSADADGVAARATTRFAALGGARTVALTMTRAFVPAAAVLSEDGAAFLAAVEPRLLLGQSALALGLVDDSLAIARLHDAALGAANRHLKPEPAAIEDALSRLRDDARAFAATPDETAPGYASRVRRVRLDAAELALVAAESALLRAGARGFLDGAPAERRLREAAFLAVLTPATKQLRAALAAAAAPR